MQTVLFSCPLLGPDVRLPLGELRDRIRQFLYDQLEEEPGLGACLLIHTCNPAAKVRTREARSSVPHGRGMKRIVDRLKRECSSKCTPRMRLAGSLFSGGTVEDGGNVTGK